MTLTQYMTLQEYEDKFVSFCAKACIGCGNETTVEKLKSCQIVRFDKYLEMGLTETPGTVSKGLQKKVDNFVNSGFGERIGSRTLGRTNN